MNFSTENTTASAIDIPLFVETAEPLLESKDTTPNETTPTTAEKNKKKGKSEEIIVKLHPSDNTKHESAIMRNIEHGENIVFKTNRKTIPVTFEFAPARKTNQINVF